MDAQDLKRLQVIQTQLESDLLFLQKDFDRLRQQLIDKTRQLEKTRREIREISNRKPVVSEHALLRYCERVLKIDIAAISNEILSEKNVTLIDHLKSGKIPCGKYRLIVKNRVVTTIEDF